METTPQALTRLDIAELLRMRRLSATDWIEALALSSIDCVSWRAYRKGLQELPRSPGWPHRISWPHPPLS